MTIYFSIDEPLLVGGNYFVVSIFELPSNTPVGSPIVVTTNGQYSFTGTEGISYALEISLYNELDLVCDVSTIQVDVPAVVTDPCDCGTISVSIDFDCNGSYNLNIESTTPTSMCGYTVTYNTNTCENPDIVQNVSGSSIDVTIPLGSSLGVLGCSPTVKVVGHCCDGSDIVCFEDVVLPTNDCGGCVIPNISYVSSSFGYDGTNGQYLEVVIDVNAGALPIVLTAIQTPRQNNDGQPLDPNLTQVITATGQYTLIIPVEPYSQLQQQEYGQMSWYIQGDNECVKADDPTGDFNDTFFIINTEFP